MHFLHIIKNTTINRKQGVAVSHNILCAIVKFMKTLNWREPRVLPDINAAIPKTNKTQFSLPDTPPTVSVTVSHQYYLIFNLFNILFLQDILLRDSVTATRPVTQFITKPSHYYFSCFFFVLEGMSSIPLIFFSTLTCQYIHIVT